MDTDPSPGKPMTDDESQTKAQTAWTLTNDDVIYPPHGFCVLFTFGPGGAMVGPFCTEEEAREALSDARICVVGSNYKPEWDR
jgi:hypothetical protein